MKIDRPSRGLFPWFQSLFGSSDSHLASRDDLQRSQSNLEVGCVGLEIVERLSDALLEL